MSAVYLALLSIAMSVAAQFALKAGVQAVRHRPSAEAESLLQTLCAYLSSPYLVLGFALYGLGAVLWLSVLARWDVSKAYPLVGAGFAATVLIGFLLGESVTAQRAAGTVLICAGVWMVARS